MMSSPGDVRIESAIACAARRDVTGVVEMNLQDVSDKRILPQLCNADLCNATTNKTSVTITDPRWKQTVAHES